MATNPTFFERLRLHIESYSYVVYNDTDRAVFVVLFPRDKEQECEGKVDLV